MHGSEGTLHQICTWITQEFGYEVAERRNWKNTVSASLSAGEQFVKGEEKEKGSGSIWRLVQTHNEGHSAYNSNSHGYTASASAASYHPKHPHPHQHHSTHNNPYNNQQHHQHHNKGHHQQATRVNHNNSNNKSGAGGGQHHPKPDDRTRVGYLISSAGEADDLMSDIDFDTQSSRSASSVRSFGNPGSLLEIVVDVLRRHGGEGTLVEILRWTREAYPQIATLMDSRTWDNKVHDCLLDRANARYFVQQQQQQQPQQQQPQQRRDNNNTGVPVLFWQLLSTSPLTVSDSAQRTNKDDIDWGAAIRGEETDDIYFGNGNNNNTNNSNSGSTNHSRHSHSLQCKPDCTTWSEKIDHVLKAHGGEGTATEICEWIEQTYPEGIVGKENWRRTVSASLSTDEGILKCPPRWGEKAAVWRLKSMQASNKRGSVATSNTRHHQTASRSDSNNRNSTTTRGRHGGSSVSSSEDEDSHSNSDNEGDEEAHALLSFVRSLSSGTSSSSGSDTESNGYAKKAAAAAAVNKMSIQTMLNYSSSSSFDAGDHDNSSEEEEEDEDRDSDASSEDSDEDNNNSDLSSAESEEEEEEDDEYRKRTHVSRSTRRSSNSLMMSNSSKRYNSISWPEKITAVMLKYGNGQGRAGDICKWIQAEYIEDIDDSKNWKNTVSAFLSNNKRFIKGDPQGASRAAVWKLSSSVDVDSDTNNDFTSRKRRRSAVAKREQPSASPSSRGLGTVTRSVAAGAPPAKRRRFNVSEDTRRSLNEDDSSDEEEEDGLMDGTESDGHGDEDDAIDERKGSAVRPNSGNDKSSRRTIGGAGIRGSVAPAGSKSQSHLVDGVVSTRGRTSTETNAATSPASSSTVVRPKAEQQKKMWPDRIEEVLLKHGGQGMAHEIHRWIEEDFMEDTVGKPGWKNLVSAHLSSNKKFVREQRAGKQGGVWILRSMLHQTSERRQPVALLSRNSPPTAITTSAGGNSQRIQLPPIHMLQPDGGVCNTTPPLSLAPLEDENDVSLVATKISTSPSSIGSNRPRRNSKPSLRD